MYDYFHNSLISSLNMELGVEDIMGGGAGPAGQVLAGPFFALLIIHKMIGVSLGLIYFLEITAIFSLCLVNHSSAAIACQ